MPEKSANLKIGAIFAVLTAALMATQAPFSVLTAKQLSVPKYICITELVLLACVPFMVGKPRSRQDFRDLILSPRHLVKFLVLLAIGLSGLLLYVWGLGKVHPIVIAAVLNLDPFWAALIAFFVVGKAIPTSLGVFLACLVVAFVGAILIAMSQSDDASLSRLSWQSLSGAWIAIPVPILTALSGTLIGKWFAKFDEAACIAVSFVVAAAVVVPATLIVLYWRSDLTIAPDTLPAIALLAVGTVLAAAMGRVVYQKSLTVTDNDNGFVSMFFLLIPAFTCFYSLAMSPWIKELKFTAGPLFFLGLALVALPIFLFSRQSTRSAATGSLAGDASAFPT